MSEAPLIVCGVINGKRQNLLFHQFSFFNCCDF